MLAIIDVIRVCLSWLFIVLVLHAHELVECGVHRVFKRFKLSVGVETEKRCKNIIGAANTGICESILLLAGEFLYGDALLNPKLTENYGVIT